MGLASDKIKTRAIISRRVSLNNRAEKLFL